MIGWGNVAAELQRRGLLARPNSFLFTSSWYQSGQLAFALSSAAAGTAAPVLCFHAWDARSFAFFNRPNDYVGEDGVLVSVNEHPAEPECFDRWFTRIDPIGQFEIDRAGAPVRKVRLYHCVRQTRPFPFDDLGRSIRPLPKGTVESRVASKGDEPIR